MNQTGAVCGTILMIVPLLAGIASGALGTPVASALQHRGEVVAVLDLITGI